MNDTYNIKKLSLLPKLHINLLLSRYILYNILLEGGRKRRKRSTDESTDESTHESTDESTEKSDEQESSPPAKKQKISSRGSRKIKLARKKKCRHYKKYKESDSKLSIMMEKNTDLDENIYCNICHRVKSFICYIYMIYTLFIY